MTKHISELSVDELEQILEVKKNIKIYQDRLNELVEDKPPVKRGPKPGRRKMSVEVRNKIRKARLKQIRKWRKEGKNAQGHLLPHAGRNEKALRTFKENRYVKMY